MEKSAKQPFIIIQATKLIEILRTSTVSTKNQLIYLFFFSTPAFFGVAFNKRNIYGDFDWMPQVSTFLVFIVTISILRSIYNYYSFKKPTRIIEASIPLLFVYRLHTAFWHLPLIFVATFSKNWGVPEEYYPLIVSLTTSILQVVNTIYILSSLKNALRIILTPKKVETEA